MPGFVNDSHAAPAEQLLHLVAANRRQLGPAVREFRLRSGWHNPRKKTWETIRSLGPGKRQSPPTGADPRQKLGTVTASFFGRAARIEKFLEQFVNTDFIKHGLGRKLRA